MLNFGMELEMYGASFIFRTAFLVQLEDASLMKERVKFLFEMYALFLSMRTAPCMCYENVLMEFKIMFFI